MTPPRFGPEFRAQLTDLFRWRRDVRRFRPDPVPPSVLAGLLEAANLAPSVGLSQPWRFVLVDSAARRAAIRQNFLAANAEALAGQHPGRAEGYARLKLEGIDQAPVQFAVFCEPDPEQGAGLGRRTMPETIAYSAVMAVYSLWLAARAEGLGLGWVSILDPATLNATLDVPPEWRFIGYFCLGTPAAESDAPELELSGWEWRRDVGAAVLRR